MVKRKQAEMKTKSNAERLNNMGHKSFVSQSTLQGILGGVQAHGLPPAFSRGSQLRARQALCSGDTPYGPLVSSLTMELKGGSQVEVGVQNPLAFIYYNCERSPAVRTLMRDAIERKRPSPCNPWAIVLYQDGVDVGDGLGKNKSRHVIIFYYSCWELG